jgi:predicted transcriptional regulator of viral defense system
MTWKFSFLIDIQIHVNGKTHKIANLEQTGKIIRLKRGMYVVSPKVTRQLLSVELIANHIYGPSYVSMESALRYYGLIPEQVYVPGSYSRKGIVRYDYSNATITNSIEKSISDLFGRRFAI